MPGFLIVGAHTGASGVMATNCTSQEHGQYFTERFASQSNEHTTHLIVVDADFWYWWTVTNNEKFSGGAVVSSLLLSKGLLSVIARWIGPGGPQMIKQFQ